MLDFVGMNHTIRYLDGRAELQIPAQDVSEGTFPTGSMWRVNPIPACNCDKGFDCGVNASGPSVAYFAGMQPVPKEYSHTRITFETHLTPHPTNPNLTPPNHWFENNIFRSFKRIRHPGPGPGRQQ